MTMVTDRLQTCEDRELCTRIVAEYLEMPGLILTVPQASRLWHSEAARCARLMDTLIASGFLRKCGDRYVRANRGREAA